MASPGAVFKKQKQISFPNRWLNQRFFFAIQRREQACHTPHARKNESRPAGKPLSRQLPHLSPSFSLAPTLKFFHNPLHEVKRMAQGFP